jgi:toxin ParE1/3/4
VKVRLTTLADRDVAEILAETYRLFGPNQTARYAAIIEAGLVLIADRPDRPGSKARADIGAGIRSFHLQLAARRQGGASHVIYYRVDGRPSSQEELVVLRLLAIAWSHVAALRIRCVRTMAEAAFSERAQKLSANGNFLLPISGSEDSFLS